MFITSQVSLHEAQQIWPQLRVLASSSPQDKYAVIKGIVDSQFCTVREVVAFVGGGINDAPVLRKSDVSLALVSWRLRLHCLCLVFKPCVLCRTVEGRGEMMSHWHRSMLWIEFFCRLLLALVRPNNRPISSWRMIISQASSRRSCGVAMSMTALSNTCSSRWLSMQWQWACLFWDFSW